MKAISACHARGGRALIGVLANTVRTGEIHEWFAAPGVKTGRGPSRQAPLGVAMELARVGQVEARICVWIGPRCWPHPPALARASTTLLGQSIFVHPANRDERLWAIDLALRSPGVAVVVADGSRLTLKETRRLQLAAEAGDTLGLLLRPPHEIKELSAARTRWCVTPAPSANPDQRWMVELLRCKGLRPTSEARRWAAQRSHATGNVSVAPDVADRPHHAAVAPLRRAL